jgi:hypothetical protein
MPYDRREAMSLINMNRLCLVAMLPILSVAVAQPSGPQRSDEAATMPTGSGALQLAAGQVTYGIRPAEGTGVSSQPPEVSAGTDVASSRDRASRIHTAGGIRYVSGGVGESERTELGALSNQFNLRLLFAMQGGDYLAAVHVDILDARGESVLTAESNGPWFFAQLAPGDYAVKVTPTGLTAGDRTQQKSVHVDGSRQTSLDFYWK